MKKQSKRQKHKLDSLICFHIDKELKERLEAFALVRGWKRSLVIREAIKQYLGITGRGKMREIKFRAWDRQGPKWVSTNVVLDYSGLLIWSFGGELRDYLETERYVIQFYTGLKDKNGKEIYEGDIVVCRDMHDGNVYGNAWTSERDASGRAIPRPLPIEKDGNGIDWKWFDDIRSCPDYWEVIGNIYENPELLEGK